LDAARHRILAVDDEERNLLVIKAMLAPLGHEIVLARDGYEGLAIASQDHIDLILLDVTMPGIDGFKVASQLKHNEATKMIPIVMVTALGDVEHRVKALEAGADDFLCKPVDSTELQVRVRTLLQVKAYHDHMRNYQQELETEVTKRTAELAAAFRKLRTSAMDTVNRLSAAAEYRDEDTGSHIVRIGLSAAAIARTLGLDADTVDRMLYSAPMHDIGKIGIPDHILLKPGKLDPDEWTIMKQHTLIGAKILAGSDHGFIQTGEQIARTHHEKWDGSGYPEGLSGPDIPIEGRITAIADVFDALTTERPYKEAFSLEKSLGIVVDGRGTHFDPEVVDAFLESKDEILAIKAQHQEQVVSLLEQLNDAGGGH
jgi:putative two-component system response regulator